MSRFFTINKQRYTALPFSFNMVCDMETLGIPMEQMQQKPFSMMRAYFSLCGDISLDDAGKELQEHIIGGGDFEDLTQAMSEEMENSDFFRSLNKRTEKETQEVESEEKPKRSRAKA